MSSTCRGVVFNGDGTYQLRDDFPVPVSPARWRGAEGGGRGHVRQRRSPASRPPTRPRREVAAGARPRDRRAGACPGRRRQFGRGGGRPGGRGPGCSGPGHRGQPLRLGPGVRIHPGHGRRARPVGRLRGVHGAVAQHPPRQADRRHRCRRADRVRAFGQRVQLAEPDAGGRGRDGSGAGAGPHGPGVRRGGQAPGRGDGDRHRHQRRRLAPGSGPRGRVPM